jgi:hypothetical protein
MLASPGPSHTHNHSGKQVITLSLQMRCPSLQSQQQDYAVLKEGMSYWRGAYEDSACPEGKVKYINQYWKQPTMFQVFHTHYLI